MTHCRENHAANPQCNEYQGGPNAKGAKGESHTHPENNENEQAHEMTSNETKISHRWRRRAWLGIKVFS